MFTVHEEFFNSEAVKTSVHVTHTYSEGRQVSELNTTILKGTVPQV